MEAEPTSKSLSCVIVEDNIAHDGTMPKDHGKRSMVHQLSRKPAKRNSTRVVDRGPDAQRAYCYKCEKDFCRPTVLRRHLDTVHADAHTLECDYVGCGQIFTRKDTMKRHKETQHGSAKVACPNCGTFVRKDGLNEHMGTTVCSSKASVAVSARQMYALPLALDTDTTFTASTGEVTLSEHFAIKEVSDTASDNAPSNSATLFHTTTSPSTYPDAASVEECSPTRSSNVAPENETIQQYVEENRKLSVTNALQNSCPQLVPDSPRLFFGDDTYNPTLADEHQALNDVAEDAPISNVVIPDEPWDSSDHMLARKQANRLLHAFQSVGGDRRFYKMALGFPCALCTEALGVDYESVFRHAKTHSPENINFHFECSGCQIKFAFEGDLKLHRTWLQTIGSQDFPRVCTVVDVYDEYDWVATASMDDRKRFVEELRRWERQQAQWYLNAIHCLLAEKLSCPLDSRGADTCPSPAQTTHKRSPDITSATIEPDARPSNFSHMDYEGLCEMFSKASLKEAMAVPGQDSPSQKLIRAVHEGDPDAVKALLHRFETNEIELTDGTWKKALFESCRKGKTRIACILLRVDHPEITSHIRIALQAAIGSGHHQLVYAAWKQESDMTQSLVQHPWEPSDGFKDLPFLQTMQGTRWRRTQMCQCLCSLGLENLRRIVPTWSTEDISTILLNGVGDLPLTYYAKAGHSDAAQGFSNEETVRDCRQNSNGNNELMVASFDGDIDVVKILLVAGAAVNATDSSGEIALTHALRENHTQVTQLLLQYGADANWTGQNGETAIHLACSRGNIPLVQMLLAAGAAVDVLDGAACTALLIALRSGHERLSRLLLQYGATAYCQDRNGLTALHWACINRLYRIAKLIIERGIDVNIRDGFGLTPLISFTRQLSDGSVRGDELLELLLKSSADVHASDHSGYTSLLYASKNGNCHAARILISHGAKINVVSTVYHHQARPNDRDMPLGINAPKRRQHSPLTMASKYGHQEMVGLLLGAGANANFTGHSKATALMYAAHNQQEDVVRTLLKHGAEASAKDESGHDALWWASSTCCWRIVAILEGKIV